MCFSPTASFVAAGILAGTGAACQKKVSQKSEEALALIPLVFAFHQFVEGIIWITFSEPIIQSIATQVYLFFSHGFWPAFIPFTVFQLETKAKRRRLLKWVAWAGAISGAILFFKNLFYYEIGTQIVNKSIQYTFTGPSGELTTFELLGTGIYTLVILAAIFVSTNRFVKWAGVVSGLAAGASFYFYYGTFASVWCFFAAALSIFIYFYLARSKKSSEN